MSVYIVTAKDYGASGHSSDARGILIYYCYSKGVREATIFPNMAIRTNKVWLSSDICTTWLEDNDSFSPTKDSSNKPRPEQTH